MVTSARTRLVLFQVTSKRTLQCVQVTDAPAAIVGLSIWKHPRDNHGKTWSTIQAFEWRRPLSTCRVPSTHSQPSMPYLRKRKKKTLHKTIIQPFFLKQTYQQQIHSYSRKDVYELFLDVWWFHIPAPFERRGPPGIKKPQLDLQTLKLETTTKEFLVHSKFILISNVWWYNNRAPVELKGPPRLRIPIPPSNPRI
jgi:hypothetical protein